MQHFDLMIGSLLMNTISSIKLLRNENVIFDIVIIFFMIVILSICNDQKFISKIKKYFYFFIFPNKNTNRITFMFKKSEQSLRCRSLFYYLTTQSSVNSKINSLSEDIFKRYDYKDDCDKEINQLYRVDQEEEFYFTKTIKGIVYTEEKEDETINGKVKYKEFIHLEIFSNSDNIETIQEFIENCKKDYIRKKKEELLENQYFITVENPNSKIKKDEDSMNNLKISKEEWSSNVSFDSRFFPNKENILNTIDHFINNEEWFKKRGLNHTLGILLSGEPGCGKTSFIKALMNHTKRHCIEVKLNDEFDFSDLKDIIYNEEIDNDIIIPQNKRIIVFEDIDAMGNIVKDRKLKDYDKREFEDKFKEEVKKIVSKDNSSSELKINSSSNDFVKIRDKICKKDNNNLSYLLNILDGINETPGRIIIMTTNRPEILDEALIRPGRIDIKINFTKSTEEDLKYILHYYWKNDNDIILKKNIFSKDLKNIYNKVTPAEIVDICRKSISIDESILRLNKFVE